MPYLYCQMDLWIHCITPLNTTKVKLNRIFVQIKRKRSSVSTILHFTEIGCYKPTYRFRFIFLFHIAFNRQCHIVPDSLRVHMGWSRFGTVNHWASASNYQLSNMKHPGCDSNRCSARFYTPHKMHGGVIYGK